MIRHSLTLEGTVFQGQGIGSSLVDLPWVRRQIRQKLGFKPYSGTLNIRLEKDDEKILRQKLNRARGIEINPKPGFLKANCFHALINRKIKGAVIIPEKQGYPPDMIEIIATKFLREEIPVKDGDRVTVTILLQC